MKRGKTKTKSFSPIQSATKKKHSTFFVYSPLLNATYTLKNIAKDTIIKDLQKYLELVCGIPYFIQRLHYLDMSDLPSTVDLKSLDIVNKATLTLKVFPFWERLVASIGQNNYKDLLTCNILENKLDQIPREQEDNQASQVSEAKRRAEVALFIAAHVGNVELVSKILSLGVDINCRTKLGYTPLHAAIARGKYNCIDSLLARGAYNDHKSELGQYALDISKLYGFSESERHLLMFEWKTRAKVAKAKSTEVTPLKMHQQYDSKCPTWFYGPYATMYLCSTMSKGEFSGTRFGAPKTNRELKPLQTEDEDLSGNSPSSDKQLSYEQWVEKKNEEKLLSYRQREMGRFEKLKEKEREEQERKRNLQKSMQRRENEKRSKIIRDDLSEKGKRINIYEEYTYVPSYGKLVLHQIFNEISIT